MKKEGFRLTKDGNEALDIIKSLYPDSNDSECIAILIGLIKDDPTLDYIRITKLSSVKEIVVCRCIECGEDIRLSLGWTGHRRWIENKTCPLCNMMLKRSAQCEDTSDT
jgi:ssDNA-binding Zn-finger/Zn-ribbon topoisomerase 1